MVLVNILSMVNWLHYLISAVTLKQYWIGHNADTTRAGISQVQNSLWIIPINKIQIAKEQIEAAVSSKETLVLFLSINGRNSPHDR